jgi:hypothetical protein
MHSDVKSATYGISSRSQRRGILQGALDKFSARRNPVRATWGPLTSQRSRKKCVHGNSLISIACVVKEDS